MRTLKESITEVAGKRESEEMVVKNDGNDLLKPHHHDQYVGSTNGYQCSVKTEGVESPTRYQCPMKCEGEKTYDNPGKCPSTKMYMIPVGGGYIFY